MTAFRSCNMVWIYFRHIGTGKRAVYMDTFEVLSPEWLYFIIPFSRIFGKPFWRLHRLSVYLEEDMNPALSGIGIICPACYIFPIHSFWQCFVADSCVFSTVQTMKSCFRYRIDQKSMFSSMFYMLKPCFHVNLRQIFRVFGVFKTRKPCFVRSIYKKTMIYVLYGQINCVLVCVYMVGITVLSCDLIPFRCLLAIFGR